MLIAALIGFCFGFFGSVPVAGPIAALVLQRGLVGRFRAGALIGVGAAVAEAGYAFLAFWGFATFLVKYPLVEPISRLLAALILVGLGVSFARYAGARASNDKRPEDTTLGSLTLGFTITALNPTLIATWTAATTTLYSTDLIELHPSSAPVFAAGTLVGIAGWFGLLTTLLRRYRGRFNEQTLAKVVRGVGWFIVLLGLWFGYRFVEYALGSPHAG